MNKKQKELAQMRYDMYKTIASAKKGFKDFTPYERILFVQKAFIDVNKYNTALYGTDPRATILGFSIGHNGTALTHNKYSMSFSLEKALTMEDPSLIYKSIFHEFKHCKQFQDEGLVYKLGLKYMPIYNKFRGNKLVWAVAPQEIGADNFAYGQMKAVMKTGLIKSKSKIEPAKDFLSWSYKRLSNFGHMNVVLDKVSHPLKTCKELNQSRTEKLTEKQAISTKVLNARQLRAIIFRNPEVFASGNFDEMEKACRIFIEKSPAAHDVHSFFVTQRRFNWNLQAVEQDCLELVPKLEMYKDEEQKPQEEFNNDTQIDVNIDESTATTKENIEETDLEDCDIQESVSFKPKIEQPEELTE